MMELMLINATQLAPSTLVKIMFEYDYISKEEDSVLLYVTTLRALGLWDIVNDLEDDVNIVKFYNMDASLTKEKLGNAPKIQGGF